MKTSTAIKGFSTLKMKEEIQTKMYEETKDMTWEEKNTYYKRKLENSTLWKEFTQRKQAQEATKPPTTCMPTRKNKQLA